MAAPRPKFSFGAKPGAPKILLATQEEVAEFSADTPPSVKSGPKPVAFLDDQRPTTAAVAAKGSSVGGMFQRKAAAAKAPKAPKEPKAPRAAAAEPPPEAAPSFEADLSKYPENLQELAIGVLGEDTENPYSNTSPRPVYPLPSRLGFQKAIVKVFANFIKIPEHGKAPDFDACKAQQASAGSALEMYEYQKFVREYIRWASPYRGLLVYHGLGSGKTCSAIAAAEALFSVSRKRIIVMTPASLRDNFIREVTFCGFQHFRTQNFWTSLDLSSPIVKIFAKEILGLDDAFIKKVGQIWVPDFTESAPNFNSLSSADRKAITTQILRQINNRITFINYNGITASKLKEIACAPPDENGNGFFDNAVIVVDEIHNLTRLMQGVIEPYLTNLPGVKRKVPLEPVTPGRWQPDLCKKVTDPRRPYLTNYKRGYLLYRLLTGARNSRLIGLSGTPLINFPEEIAILINLLGGYIHTVSFAVTPASEANQQKVKRILNENPFVDFVEVDLLGLNMNVMFTMLPEGLKKVEGGAQRLGPEEEPPSLTQVTEIVTSAITAAGLKIAKAPEFKSEAILPPVGDDFKAAFLSPNGQDLKNVMVLRKRIQGLISYYRGSKKELMPQVTRDDVIRVPLSPYAQAEYQRVRGEELKIQMEKKKKAGAGDAGLAGAGAKMAGLWAQIHELAAMKSSNSYRMGSRQACNFAFPEGISRPRPTNTTEAIEEIGEDTEILDDAALAEVPGGAAVELPAEEGGGGEEAAVAAAAEDRALDEALAREALAEAEAAGDAEAVAAFRAELEAQEAPLIRELAANAGEQLEGAAAPRAEAKPTLSAANRMKAARQKAMENCKKGRLAGEPYATAIERTKQCLENFALQKLRLFGLGKKVNDEIKAESPLDPERLAKYSPKYAQILVNILQAPGSSLVYSQFLEMEGIGIFRLAMRANDFKPIEIEPTGDGSGRWQFSAKTLAHLKLGPEAGIHRYLAFTGETDAVERAQCLKIFNARYQEDAEGNGSYPDMDSSLAQVLLESGFKGNLHGELCRVFCITSAGAEGLSLRNVRRVHIMEPYWNHVRTDQVKGRAVRICSHVDLEYNSDPSLNERTVEVFTYCAVFDDQAQLHTDGTGGFPRIDQTIIGNDGVKPEEAVEMGLLPPAGATQYVITSDEYLYSLSERKKKLLQNIQNVMKTSAVDCTINEYENEEEGLACVRLPGTPDQFAFHPILSKDIAETVAKFRESVGGVELAPGAEAAAQDEEGGPRPAVAVPVVKPQGPKTVKAFVMAGQDGKQYIAVPELEPGQVEPLSFKIYARGDIRQTLQIGTTVAEADGRPSSEIDFF